MRDSLIFMKRAIIILFILLVFSPFVNSLDCPLGKVNDTYPGDCGLYTDLNKDSVCDYSQELSPLPGVKDNGDVVPTKEYYFLEIAGVSVVFYIISFLLARKNIISIVLHRRFWNFLLLISFLGVGISGILLVLNLNYGFLVDWPFSMLFWHVETGVVMTLISIFHIFWHLPYFKSYFKRRG